MLIVADTSALVALAACDSLALLDQLFRDVRVPAAVLEECTVPGKPEAERLGEYLRGKVVEVDLQEFVIAAPGLGQGELQAMALCKRLHADWLLVDDQRARRIARLNDIEVIGSLGILLRAKESELVSEIRPLLAAMQGAGLHYAPEIIEKALRDAGER
jgi:predicted nucleic acid-binding protein